MAWMTAALKGCEKAEMKVALTVVSKADKKAGQ